MSRYFLALSNFEQTNAQTLCKLFFLLHTMSKPNENLIPYSTSRLSCRWAFASPAQRLDRHEGGEGGKEMGRGNAQRPGPAAPPPLPPGASGGAAATAVGTVVAAAAGTGCVAFARPTASNARFLNRNETMSVVNLNAAPWICADT